MRGRLFSIACSLVLVVAVSHAQRAPASIRGRVVAAENDRALPRARLFVTADGRPVDAVFTDDRGRFSISIPAGSNVALSVTKAGYAVEQVAVPSTTSPGELAIRLSRSVAISGRVTDPSGEGAVDVRVIAQRQDLVEEGRGPSASRFETTTDDLGDYRLGGLPAGRYTMSVTDMPGLIVQGRRSGGEQTSLELRTGDEIGSIDFSVPVFERFSYPPRDAQPAPVPGEKGTGAISGRVLSASGRPLEGARVRALRNGVTPRGAPTDAQGRFTIAQLPAGSYTLDASRTGYVTIQYGQERAAQPGKSVLVRDDETTAGADLVLPRGTAVSGTIVDEHGEPLQGVNVRAMQLRYTSGRTTAVNVGPRDRQTDDRGRYRLYGLLPGSYVIVASVEASISGATASGYAPLFYPGTTQASEASPIAADLGRDVSAIDLVFAETPAARVSATVRTSDATPFTGNVLLMASQRSGSIAVEPQRPTMMPDGSFVFPNVPPGDYVVQAMRAREGNRGFSEFGAQFVTIAEGAPKPLTITTLPGATLTGRIVHEGPSSLPRMERPSFMPFPTDFDRAPAIGGGTFSMSQRADGTFTVAGLFGPTRFRMMGSQDDWYLKSITIGGLDITDIPFDFGLGTQTVAGAEVVVSNAAAAIGGHVTDSASAPVGSYSVIVFSTDRSKWFTTSRFLRLARPAQDGSFEVLGLPPGEYWVAAVDPVEGNEVSGDWLKPETLEQLSFRATRVTLMERERFMTVLRVIRR